MIQIKNSGPDMVPEFFAVFKFIKTNTFFIK